MTRQPAVGALWLVPARRVVTAGRGALQVRLCRRLRKSYPVRYPQSKISLFVAEIADAPMMHGREKSDLAIVAVKPANKAKEAHRGGICGGGRSGVGGAKGGGQGECAPAKHVLGSEPGSRDKGAGAYTATLPSHTRCGRSYGAGGGGRGTFIVHTNRWRLPRGPNQ